MANTLGQRGYYEYTDDVGNQYKYQTDRDLGTAVGATLNATLDDLPRRFRPRGIYVEATVSGRRVRKFVICPTADNEAYAANASQVVTIGGTAFNSTGRRGERVTFGTNS